MRREEKGVKNGIFFKVAYGCNNNCNHDINLFCDRAR